MKSNINIDELLRYLSTGALSLVAYYLSTGYDPRPLIQSIGVFGSSVLAFAIGTILYYSYRFLHNTLLFRLKDCLTGNKNNLRTFVMDKYKIDKSSDAELFWSSIKVNLPEGVGHGMKKEASGIHLMYIVSILSLTSSVVSVFHDSIVNLLIFLIFSIITFIIAIYMDISFEKIELLLFLSNQDTNYEKVAKQWPISKL